MDKAIETLIEWSNGNVGAATFLSKVIAPENLLKTIPIIKKLDEEKSLRGWKLHVLWSDLCDKNMDSVINLCVNCPSDILIDACSRQDYSGRELIKEYL